MIKYLAGISGLFHDWGKANALFQQQLTQTGIRSQPLRHEWVSLRLFAAFVLDKTDEEWLTAMIAGDYAQALTAFNDVPETPLAGMPPLARAVGWLIISHHRMPLSGGMDGADLDALAQSWGYENNPDYFKPTHYRKVMQITTHTLPSCRALGARLARRALAKGMHEPGRYELHMARMALILADHYISSLPAPGCGGELWANTDKEGQLRQPLDWHLRSVALAAYSISKNLHRAADFMPALREHPALITPTDKPKFAWQNVAFDAVRDNVTGGFFGVNLASTGCGKTFANARIMAALGRGRFSVALGLRSLTLQTGAAFQNKMGLHTDDLAVMVGGVNHALQEEALDALDCGYTRYSGQLSAVSVQKLAGVNANLLKLLSAPVLTSTIDHLMPACESLRGGRHIAPLLRLLTSDLVLDEPDDFDLADQHALCRLVHFAGLCGSRVLLSSATLLPAMIRALHKAWLAGWQAHCEATGRDSSAVVGFFDEDRADVSADLESAMTAFLRDRVARLTDKQPLRLAQLLPVAAAPADAIAVTAATIRDGIMQLHAQHHQVSANGQRVSLGLVRFANINPMVAVAQAMMQTPAPAGYTFHFCVYHSRHPLFYRSHIENRLDATLTRYDSGAIFQQPEIASALAAGGENHVFIVLATSVAEVGRDWDFDWAIAEPSSMRSLIQLAGRIQRHRQQLPDAANMLILSNNLRALRKPGAAAFCMPGFEADGFKRPAEGLEKLLDVADYARISSIPRLSINKRSWLSALEHARSVSELAGKPGGEEYHAGWFLADDWHQTGDLQRLKPFRAGDEDAPLYLRPPFEPLIECDGELVAAPSIYPFSFKPSKGNKWWFSRSYNELFDELREELKLDEDEAVKQFAALNVKPGRTFWHERFGVFNKVS